MSSGVLNVLNRPTMVAPALLAMALVLGGGPERGQAQDSVRQGPRVLSPAAVGVGRWVPDMALVTREGRSVKLSQVAGPQGLVIALTNTSCPLCGKYGPSLAQLEANLTARGFGLLMVNATANESADAMGAFVTAHKLRSPYVHDRDAALARQLGATSTTETFLLDRQRTVIYRGALDDQYGLGYALETPRRTFLLDAIEALLANRPVDPAATTAPGCELDLGPAKAAPTAVTYHNRISRIIAANCVECHRAGGVGPFSLETYDDVTAHAGMIARVVQRGTMPPWFAAPEPAGKASPWANDRSLPAADKADLLAWLKSDRPVGQPADAPRPRTFQDGWLIGRPDAVFEFPAPVPVKASGVMAYQNITVETHLAEDKWVKAIEVQPSAREVVHHVLVFLVPPGERGEGAANPREAAARERQGFFGAYVPGQSTLSYPDDYAKRLPRGSRLRFQMHYTPNGQATEDRTRIGLVFASRPPQFEVKVIGLINPRLSIPPGADHHPETAMLRVPGPVQVLGFLPHMHLRGKAFRYEITAPGQATTQTVLDIPHYDFNWQLHYRLAEPIPLAAGTTIKATGWFDNSSANPANPDPSKTVRWGQQTTDEMMLGYVEYLIPVGATPPMPRMAFGGGFDPAQLASGLFARIDSDANGSISRAEFEAAAQRLPRFRNNPAGLAEWFDRLDTNSDGQLSPAEFEKVRLP